MRKYGVKLDEQFAKHIYQVPPPLPLPETVGFDWGSAEGSYSANVWVSPLTVGNNYTIAPPISLEKSYEEHIRELMENMEFYARYEKSEHERFVQYEPKDREFCVEDSNGTEWQTTMTEDKIACRVEFTPLVCVNAPTCCLAESSRLSARTSGFSRRQNWSPLMTVSPSKRLLIELISRRVARPDLAGSLAELRVISTHAAVAKKQMDEYINAMRSANDADPNWSDDDIAQMILDAMKASGRLADPRPLPGIAVSSGEPASSSPPAGE